MQNNPKTLDLSDKPYLRSQQTKFMKLSMVYRYGAVMLSHVDQNGFTNMSSCP